MKKSLFIKLTENKRTKITLGHNAVQLYIVPGADNKSYTGNVNKIVSTVASNLGKYKKFIATSLYSDYKKHWSKKGETVSQNDLEKSLTPEYMSIHQDGGVTLSFYDDGKFFRGHIIELILTPTLKPEGAPSIQG